MSSIQPLSGNAASSLIFELESLDGVLGNNPITGSGPSAGITPNVKGRRINNLLKRMRTRTFPTMMQSLNASTISVLRRVVVQDPDDPLGDIKTTTTEAVYAAVLGPSQTSLDQGLLSVDDLEVVIAAHGLSSAIDEDDGFRISGVDYSIADIRPYPTVPSPVAYRFYIKKVA